MRKVLLVALLALAAACGDGTRVPTTPESVSDGLVPRVVHEGTFAFHESDLPVEQTFAEAGPRSLAADGRLWELRKADRLVGVLQLTTLLPEVELLDTRVRDSIVKQLLPTARERYDVGDVTVWSASTNSGKTSYVWFGQGLFALMTIKPGSNDALEPERVLGDVLDHMVSARDWEYVYFDDEDDAS